jgi:hypothetical protein
MHVPISVTSYLLHVSVLFVRTASVGTTPTEFDASSGIDATAVHAQTSRSRREIAELIVNDRCERTKLKWQRSSFLCSSSRPGEPQWVLPQFAVGRSVIAHILTHASSTDGWIGANKTSAAADWTKARVRILTMVSSFSV